MLACATNTRLLESSDIPNDVKERVRETLSYCSGNSGGSYSESCGIEIIRKHIAKYIEIRDEGVKCDWQNIFLSTGASQCIETILSLVNESAKPGKSVGVMIPTPQCPLYPVKLREYGMFQVNYYLNEDKNWCLDMTT